MKTLHTALTALTVAAVILLSSITNSFGQYQERSYDLRCGAVSGTDQGRAITNRVEGGYAISGYSYINVCGIGPFDWMFVKVFPSGIHELARIIGTQGDDKCYSLIQVRNDSGHVLAGDMYQVPGLRAATLVKLGKTAMLQFARKIDDTVNSQYFQVIVDSTSLRRWAFTGMNERPFGGKRFKKILATQYSNSGVLNWGYRYDSYINANTFSKSQEEAVSICYQSAGTAGYGLAVKTNRFLGNTGNDIMIVKLNTAGAVIWNKIYRFNMTPSPSAVPSKIIPMTDGGFVVVGTTNAFATADIFVLRVSSTGAVIWSNTYGTTSATESGQSIVLDSTFLVVTGYRLEQGSSANALLMKIPVTGGAPLWTKIWDTGNAGSEVGYDLVNSTQSAANGYAVTGETSRGANLLDPFLWRTDDNGQLPGMNCQDSVILQTYTNNHKIDTLILKREVVKDCPINPSIVNPNVFTSTYCMAHTAPPNGGRTELDNSIIEPNDYSLNQNFPNPFNPTTKIAYSIKFAGNVTIKVYDSNGKELMVLQDGMKSEGKHEIEFNGANLSSGIYYYKITSGNFTDVKKMMLIK